MLFTKVLCVHTAQGLGFLEKQVSNAINLKEPQMQGAERESRAAGSSHRAVEGCAGQGSLQCAPACQEAQPSQGSQ